MAKKRDRLEIIYSILRIIHNHRNSIRVTPLLRYSNLSSESYSEYYKELLEKNLIRESCDSKGRKYISLTDMGFKFIEKYKYIQEFIDEFEI